jgi:hypothetical protein
LQPPSRNTRRPQRTPNRPFCNQNYASSRLRMCRRDCVVTSAPFQAAKFAPSLPLVNVSSGGGEAYYAFIWLYFFLIAPHFKRFYTLIHPRVFFSDSSNGQCQVCVAENACRRVVCGLARVSLLLADCLKREVNQCLRRSGPHSPPFSHFNHWRSKGLKTQAEC